MTGILDYPKPPGMPMSDAVTMAGLTAAVNGCQGYRITCPHCRLYIEDCDPVECRESFRLSDNPHDQFHNHRT
jgi:hypothetical protein